MNRRIQRLVAGLLIACLVGTANAGLIAESAQSDRQRIAAHLQREDVAAELARRGIAMQDAHARVDALSDEEAASLAGKLDELPAGGFVQVLVMAAVVAAKVIVMVGTLAVTAVAGVVGAIAKSSSKGGTQ